MPWPEPSGAGIAACFALYEEEGALPQPFTQRTPRPRPADNVVNMNSRVESLIEVRVEVRIALAEAGQYFSGEARAAK